MCRICWSWRCAAKEAGLVASQPEPRFCALGIVPLFETIEDLRAAPAIMHDWFGIDLVNEWLNRRERKQEIMLGYFRTVTKTAAS